MDTKIPCPRCNSPRKFGKLERRVSDNIEIYIRCSVCHYEKVLNVVHKDKIKRLRRANKLKSRAKNDPHLLKLLHSQMKNEK
jgi:isopropylmalate/homocitrate/citramalate synthase